MATSFRTMCIAAALAAFVTIGGDAQQRQPQPPAPSSPPASQPQDPQSPQPSAPPVFRSGINYVRVDVIVNDNKSGEPVDDLKPGDFEVLEDNKPQKIENFKLIKLDGGRIDSTNEPPKPIRTDYDEESEAARDDVRLFGIFLDDYHVRKGTSLSVRNPLASFIEK